ncbi:PstS family phosphate ABC transporter substrate-binding protein [Blastococcus sp. PRF04-17]|uniref:PstS family phosphate ABC transporter substrate-binding protein n=1 Tax=Blastococcus sp. PRF04-17 TaxID=2933797 RepID=UPI001FF3D0EC|nr:PstS family phosphate ABC transporter substrate-binding protein [Blastococcus sp. PRF04-17]UOY00906.1 PstS family phosphate ABC transporter substrate-binding protein [Blastococcus sp. PRF04-17]
MTTSTLRRGSVPAAAVLSLALGLSACGGSNEADAGSGDSALSGEVLVDGSSTVQPLTAAAGEFFAEEEPGVNVSVGTSGTGGGFKVFCQGETDISNASRPIKDEEAALCEENGIDFTELQVATDALTVVVSADNDFISCLTTEELATLWGPDAEGTVTTWDQVNPEFPAERIELYGPGTDSGTFDYFTDEINGEEGVSRTDYNASEDDNVLVQGVSGSANAIGYFGYTYYEENAEALKAVEIDSGEGCVAPSAETAQDGSYTPWLVRCSSTSPTARRRTSPRSRRSSTSTRRTTTGSPRRPSTSR